MACPLASCRLFSCPSLCSNQFVLSDTPLVTVSSGARSTAPVSFDFPFLLLSTPLSFHPHRPAQNHNHPLLAGASLVPFMDTGCIPCPWRIVFGLRYDPPRMRRALWPEIFEINLFSVVCCQFDTQLNSFVYVCIQYSRVLSPFIFIFILVM